MDIKSPYVQFFYKNGHTHVLCPFSERSSTLKIIPTDFQTLNGGPVTLVTVFENHPIFPLSHNSKIMATNIITLEDLQVFKQELFAELQKLLLQKQTTPTRKWLKSNEVRRLLLVSPGTLQSLRINGTLPYTKIGGVIFYDYDDIQKMIQDHKRISPLNGTSLRV
jgi:hypothetical protein